MKIKNIKDYRKFYKEEVRDLPTRDENFIGNVLLENGKKKFGWFDIYHGDKEGYGDAESGIENFLQSFLEMARDGQAVYEFLQNAVDAKSSHYTMVWGKDDVDNCYYLMVANNGDMFSLNSVRSILNVGSSTKTADSKTIGKFGIGFKLAHRLVGKDNGLDELLHANSGPLLFSWQNYEIEQLAGGTLPQPNEMNIVGIGDNQYEAKDTAPWLFKILITCFPTLPENDYVEELPKMLNGSESSVPPFSKAEYETLSRWVRKYTHILTEETYRTGALFFIKLGEGKESELADENLQEGVRFALAILNETASNETKNVLSTIQLNDSDPITLPELDYVKFEITKSEEPDRYAYIRFGEDSYAALNSEQLKKLSQESDVEVLFGFRPYDKIDKYFKGAPNFYLYFPLSEEVHNFNYILHSNAFYKGSSRTFLHPGSGKEDGINERLLKTIVYKIEEEFVRLTTSESSLDRRKFLDFYAALLSSSKSFNKALHWIEEPYINRITKLLKNYIPIRNDQHSDKFSIANDPTKVFIKDTGIDIDLHAWGIRDVNWFYWGEGAELLLKEKAIAKLEIKKYSIKDLLTQADDVIGRLNDWIGHDDVKMEVILKEIPLEPSILNKKQRDNLFRLNLFLFQENEVHSIESFKVKDDKGYFISRNKLVQIRDILAKLQLRYSLNDAEEFTKSYQSYFNSTSQLSSYEILTNRFSDAVTEEGLKKLSDEEKLRVFNAFRTFNDTPGQRMVNLKIFSNRKGDYLKLQHLLAESQKEWLSPYTIEKDFGALVKTYLIKEDKEIYQAIIHPFWDAIATDLCSSPISVESVLSDIEMFYEQSSWTGKGKNLIDESAGVFFKAGLVQTEKIFYSNNLKSLSAKKYNQAQDVLERLQNIIMPDQFFLGHIDTLPFDFTSDALEWDIKEDDFDLEDINCLLDLDRVLDGNFFRDHALIKNDSKHSVTKNKKQIYTQNRKLLKYIDIYHPDRFVLLADEFVRFSDRVELSHSSLVTLLIKEFTEGDLGQELSLIDAILDEGLKDQQALFEKLTVLGLDASWREERQNHVYLKLAQNLLSIESDDFNVQIIHEKLSINLEEVSIIVGAIHNAEDSILIPFNEKKIQISQSQLLDLEDKDGIFVVEQFSLEAVKRGIILESTSEILFKRNKIGVSDGLVDLFNEKLCDYKLINSHQLIFLLFCGRYEKADFKNYQVKSFDNIFYDLCGNLAIYNEENEAFVNPAYLLHPDYEGIQTLLGISDFEAVIYGPDEDDLLIPNFLFVNGANPGALKEASERIPLLNYLFKYWNLLGNQRSILIDDESWERVLAINPSHYVLGNLVVCDENLPDDIADWVGGLESKKAFMSAIGVQGETSDIINLRQWLLTKSHESTAIKDPTHYPPVLLYNTLKGLSGEFENIREKKVQFHATSPQILFLEGIYLIYSRDSESEYIPDLVHAEKDVFEVVHVENDGVYEVDNDLLELLHQDQNNKLKLLFKSIHIAKSSLAEIFDFEKLELSERFVFPVAPFEHDEPFYNSWKSIYNTRLFKVERLNFNVYYLEEQIGMIEKGGVFIDESGTSWKDVYYVRTLSLENLLDTLGGGELFTSLSKMIHDKDTMLRNLYNVMNGAGKDEISDANLRALKIAMQQETLIQERQAYAVSMRNMQKYSFDWFESYLSYLATFEAQQRTIQQKTIFFQEMSYFTINKTISDKFFLLKAANSLIPVNIEEFSDFAIEVTFKDKSKEKILVEGVSKKGQDLLIYCRSSLTSEVMKNLVNILSVKISFTPKLDLLRELYNAFINVNNIRPWEEIKDALPPLKYLYGPPGTGKTTEVCKIVSGAFGENPNVRVLLMTPTNKAADVVASRLLRDHASVSVIRLGKPTDGELEQAGIYQESINTIEVAHTNIIASTVHRIPYFKVNGEGYGVDKKLFEFQDHWDYVIFDESSMISLPYIVFCIQAIKGRNPRAKIIIAGDPQQIPPVSALSDAEVESLNIDEENVYKMMGVNSFVNSENQVRDFDTMEQLTVQYRSLPEIGQLFSELSYGGRLEHHRKHNTTPRSLPERFKSILFQHVSFINIPLDENNSVFAIGKLFYSAYHLHSAIFIAEIVRYLDCCLEENEVWTIGLIAPYKAQAALMNRIITSYGISEKVKIMCDTVHGFQGDECDMVFFVVNPNQTYYTGDRRSLLSKKYIYNVAVSRAKDYLIILHPYKTISGNVFINGITQSYNLNYGENQVRDYRVIEKIILGDSNFIEKNSYITGHDSINVFGQTDIKYFVKSSDQAIDIVING